MLFSGDARAWVVSESGLERILASRLPVEGVPVEGYSICWAVEPEDYAAL